MQAVADDARTLRSRRGEQLAEFPGLRRVRVRALEAREQPRGLVQVVGLDLDSSQPAQRVAIAGHDAEEFQQGGATQVVAAALAPQPCAVEQDAHVGATRCIDAGVWGMDRGGRDRGRRRRGGSQRGGRRDARARDGQRELQDGG